MKHERIAQRAMRTFVENLEHACYGAETKADAILAVDREHASLLAENERLRAALSGTLTALRLARDSEPERWDALMGSRIGPEVAIAWDKLNAALAGGKASE